MQKCFQLKFLEGFIFVFVKKETEEKLRKISVDSVFPIVAINIFSVLFPYRFFCLLPQHRITQCSSKMH